MRQLNTTYHSGMAGYLMDFGFGGFIGYGKGVSVGLVMEEEGQGTGTEVNPQSWTQHLPFICEAEH